MNDKAFEALWRAQFPQVARTASGIVGSTQDGMEIAQEAFARAYQHWRKVSKMDRPDAWVHRVAANLAISHRRRSRLESPVAADRIVDAPEPPDEVLFAALRTLTPSQRAVLVLRFYLDWSVEEVAEVLGKKPGTVRALTHQGMQRLRAVLTKEPQDD